MKISEMSGSPLSFEIGGEKVLLSPPTLEDLGTLESFCVSELSKRCKESGKSASEEEIANWSLFNPKVFHIRRSIEGVKFELHLAYKRANPNNDSEILDVLISKEPVGAVISKLLKIQEELEKSAGLFTSDPIRQ